MAFIRNQAGETHLASFSKEEILEFRILNFESGKFLGKKFFLPFPLGLPKFHKFLSFLFIFTSTFSKACFPEQCELSSHICKIMRIYNLGDKNVETDFGCDKFWLKIFRNNFSDIRTLAQRMVGKNWEIFQ